MCGVCMCCVCGVCVCVWVGGVWCVFMWCVCVCGVGGVYIYIKEIIIANVQNF